MITLQQPSSPSLACAGWYRLPHLAEKLCLHKALLHTLASTGLGHQCGWDQLGQGWAVVWGNYHLLLKYRSVLGPKEGTSISLPNVFLPTKASLQTDSGEEPFWTKKQLSSGDGFLSSFASLSWTRDFFTQITLENCHYAKTLSAMVKTSWGKGQLTLRCPSRVISRSSYHGIWTGMLLAGHLSCKRKNKRCTNYTARTTMFRVIYILIVLIWGPSAESLKEAVAEKTSVLLLNFTASLYSGKCTWKAQLYYILTNFISALGRCFKHCNEYVLSNTAQHILSMKTQLWDDCIDNPILHAFLDLS